MGLKPIAIFNLYQPIKTATLGYAPTERKISFFIFYGYFAPLGQLA